MGIFWKKFFEIVENGIDWFYLIEHASEMSKIILSVFVYSSCLNKTTKMTNRKQFCWHFFLNNPLCTKVKQNEKLAIKIKKKILSLAHRLGTLSTQHLRMLCVSAPIGPNLSSLCCCLSVLWCGAVSTSLTGTLLLSISTANWTDKFTEILWQILTIIALISRTILPVLFKSSSCVQPFSTYSSTWGVP